MLLGPLPDRPSLQQEVCLKIHGRTRQSRATSLPRKRLSFSTNPNQKYSHDSKISVHWKCLSSGLLVEAKDYLGMQLPTPGRQRVSSCSVRDSICAASYRNREGVSQGWKAPRGPPYTQGSAPCYGLLFRSWAEIIQTAQVLTPHVLKAREYLGGSRFAPWVPQLIGPFLRYLEQGLYEPWTKIAAYTFSRSPYTPTTYPL